MGNLFKRGYDASRQEKEKQEKERENRGKKLYRFFLINDGDEADLRFLTEEPVNFREHSIKVGDRYEAYTCTGDNCSLCEDGDRPTYKGAYLVVDRREFEYTDKDGKKQKGKNQLRLFVQGMKVVSQLDRISEKYGLSNRDVTIVRLGKGTQTTYTIERGDEEKLTEKEIRALLPEKLRDEYDGTMDSLMEIVEEQLMLSAKDYEPDDSEDEDEEDDKTISLDDEDEEEDNRPKKKALFKRPQNSTKPRVKGMFSDDELPF